MTPRKEVFIKAKQALQDLPGIELIDLYRKQYDGTNKPPQWTAALIRVNRITWEDMVEQRQEGTADVDVMLYTKDGWMNQQQGTTDPDDGLTEIDLIDGICERLDGLQGESFKPLKLVSDEVDDNSSEGIMSYRINFKTKIYRIINARYEKKRIGFQPTNFTT
jgi:hypothetical protein